MSKADKRAIKITELNEELERAKAIIAEFVWPPDATAEQRQAFVQSAAHFAGCSIPHYAADGEQESSPNAEHQARCQASPECSCSTGDCHAD